MKPDGKQPFVHFYPGDHERDPGVQELDAVSEFIWLKMIFLMSECSPRGQLAVNGKPMSLEVIARRTKCALATVKNSVDIMLKKGVASIDKATGIIFSRRMMRDEQARARARKFGKQGGNPMLKNQPAPAPKKPHTDSRLIEWNGNSWWPSSLQKTLADAEKQADKLLNFLQREPLNITYIVRM